MVVLKVDENGIAVLENEVIERHMIDIGFVRPGGALPSDPYADVGLVPADIMAEGAPPFA